MKLLLLSLLVVLMGCLPGTEPSASKVSPAGVVAEVLPAAKVAKLKNRPCAFVHLWASWCAPCIEELPGMVEFFNKEWLENKKKFLAPPIIIDVSSPTEQKKFSTKFMGELEPRFKTYRKPGGQEGAYIDAIDKAWTGGLPYSILLKKGKKVEVWKKKVDLGKLRKKITALCK